MIVGLFIWLLVLQSEPSGNLIVEIKGINTIKGDIRVALYTSSHDFPSDAFFKVAIKKVNGGSVQVIFENVPHGKYAMSVFHDENENGKLDTGLFGVPKEPYGFSNDVMGTFGPPSFEDATVVHNTVSATHSITLR